jgi:hypothetical protein
MVQQTPKQHSEHNMTSMTIEESKQTHKITKEDITTATNQMNDCASPEQKPVMMTAGAPPTPLVRNEIPATSRTDRSNKLLTTNRDRQTEYEYYDEEDEDEQKNVYDFKDFMDDKLPLQTNNNHH